ncbi:MATE efflux family protein [Spiroplasma litorale]|uniref:MATE efflux family protein n=1 Tax=Spiroplasma litorale TaxID=216942 RepID=A0A0K1W316_9MOLU|nr:MATE family efflux transporter [Spiroplasma litorale]AKX34715.1 MATE efflux family protein [Spiroplasma litorale]
MESEIKTKYKFKEFENKHTVYITKREWILRYSHPFAALMFMAGPMMLIALVNGLYGVLDKQLTLNFAINQIEKLYNNYLGSGVGPGISYHSTIETASEDVFKQIINVSTQYSNTVVIILESLSMLTAIGTAINFGQYMGQRDQKKMNQVLINGLIQTIILSLISILVMYFLSQFILVWQTGVPWSDRDSTLSYSLSKEYCSVFVFSFPLLSLAMFTTTLLRTEGKIWFVVIINLVSVVINAIFGYIFLDILQLGMAGAVYGSMVAWTFMIVCSVILVYTSKNTFLRPEFKKFRFNNKEGLDIWLNGVGPFFMNGAFGIISGISTRMVGDIHNGEEMYRNGMAIKVIFFPNASDKSYYHEEYITDTVRVLSSAFPWNMIIWAPVVGILQGGVNSIAYSKGAKKDKRLWEIIKWMLIINFVWMTILLLILTLFGSYMMQMFDGPTNGGWKSDDKRWWFLMYLSCILFSTTTYAAMPYFNGIGKSYISIILSLARTFVFQISFLFIGYYVAKAASNDGTKDWLYFLIYSFSEIPAGIIAFILLFFAFKKSKKIGIVDKADDFEKISYFEAKLSQLIIDHNKRITILNNKLKDSDKLLEQLENENKVTEKKFLKVNNKNLNINKEKTA